MTKNILLTEEKIVKVFQGIFDHFVVLFRSPASPRRFKPRKSFMTGIFFEISMETLSNGHHPKQWNLENSAQNPTCEP